MQSVKEMKAGIRIQRMFLNEVYFWTDTIKDWNTAKSLNFKHIIKTDFEGLLQF